MALPKRNCLVLKELNSKNTNSKVNKRKRSPCKNHENGKRKRPNAAMQEKERLKTFNDALEKLQRAIPVRLPKGRKLHKKQTLKLASCYIRFLRGCLEGTNNWSDRHRFLWFPGSQQQDILKAIDIAAHGRTFHHANNESTESKFHSTEYAEIDISLECVDPAFDTQLPQAKLSKKPLHGTAVTNCSSYFDNVNMMSDLDEILNDLHGIDCQGRRHLSSDFKRNCTGQLYLSSSNSLPHLPQDVVEKVLEPRYEKPLFYDTESRNVTNMDSDVNFDEYDTTLASSSH